MKITPENAVLKSEKLDQVHDDLKKAILNSVQDGLALHEVEKAIWEQVLKIGREALKLVLDLHGNGDRGEEVELPDGRVLQRLEKEHRRRYVSIFGEFTLFRVVYGSREGQKIELVPLDNRLQLPESPFSYLLQDWDQSFCVEQAFGQVSSTVARLLGLKQSVDSLEHMNQHMAQNVTRFLLNRPPPEQEGAIMVASADQKGIVMRRTKENPPPKAHRTKGDKASQKRMATVVTVYSVAPYVRTPEEVVAALFRDTPPAESASRRPEPQGKQVWATLPPNEQPGSGINRAFAWIVGELSVRGQAEAPSRPLVYLSDGQEALWTARAEWLPEAAVDILDLLHVTPRLWQAAHAFHKEGGAEAEAFVRERLVRVLQGKAEGVVRGLREMATKRGLVGAKRKSLAKACAYLGANLERMRYDEYLRAGYPIASGVVEGACRHLVKDRLERAGMHWTLPGAQALLDLRSIHVTGLWDDYQAAYVERETARLYPHRTWLDQTIAMAA